MVEVESMHVHWISIWVPFIAGSFWLRFGWNSEFSLFIPVILYWAILSNFSIKHAIAVIIVSPSIAAKSSSIRQVQASQHFTKTAYWTNTCFLIKLSYFDVYVTTVTNRNNHTKTRKFMMNDFANFKIWSDKKCHMNHVILMYCLPPYNLISMLRDISLTILILIFKSFSFTVL